MSQIQPIEAWEAPIDMPNSSVPEVSEPEIIYVSRLIEPQMKRAKRRGGKKGNGRKSKESKGKVGRKSRRRKRRTAKMPQERMKKIKDVPVRRAMYPYYMPMPGYF